MLVLVSPLGEAPPRMQQHYDSGAGRVTVVVGQHNDAKIKCDQIAFLNTAFYSYDKNLFCGNRCYLFCTSILHDIKTKRGQKEEKNRILKKQALCVYFSGTDLCMPIRVEHFDVVITPPGVRCCVALHSDETSFADFHGEQNFIYFFFFLHVEPDWTKKKSGFDFISRRRLSANVLVTPRGCISLV